MICNAGLSSRRIFARNERHVSCRRSLRRKSLLFRSLLSTLFFHRRSRRFRDVRFLLFLHPKLLLRRQRLFLHDHAHLCRTLADESEEAVRGFFKNLDRAALLRKMQGEECSFDRLFHRLSGLFHEIRHIRQPPSFPRRPRCDTSTTAARSARGSSSPNRGRVPKRSSG